MHNYEFERPSVTVDLLIFNCERDRHEILLVERSNDPFKGKLAFPGGFMDMGETAIQAAIRELKEETGIVLSEPDIYFNDYHDEVSRDPRGRTISFSFYTCFYSKPKLEAGDDAASANFYNVFDPVTFDLAFDHARILNRWLLGQNKTDWERRMELINN